jgi:hypothetical protein
MEGQTKLQYLFMQAELRVVLHLALQSKKLLPNRKNQARLKAYQGRLAMVSF